MSETVLTFKNFFTQHENGYKCYKEGNNKNTQSNQHWEGEAGGRSIILGFSFMEEATLENYRQMLKYETN